MGRVFFGDGDVCVLCERVGGGAVLPRRLSSVTSSNGGPGSGAGERVPGDMATEVCRQIPTAEIDFVPNDRIVKLAHSMPKAVDDKLARQEWGWEPQYTWQSAVRDFIYELEKNPKLYEPI